MDTSTDFVSAEPVDSTIHRIESLARDIPGLGPVWVAYASYLVESEVSYVYRITTQDRRYLELDAEIFDHPHWEELVRHEIEALVKWRGYIPPPLPEVP